MALSFIICAVLLVVAVYDAMFYRIPNWLVLLLLALYPVLIFSSHTSIDWLMALAGAGICFIIGFALFALRLTGGGDIKLLTAAALWAGFGQLLPFLFNMALLGGALSLLLLLGRAIVAFSFPAIMQHPRWPRLLTTGAPVPYGVAISFSLMIEIIFHGVPGLPAILS